MDEDEKREKTHEGEKGFRLLEKKRKKWYEDFFSRHNLKYSIGNENLCGMTIKNLINFKNKVTKKILVNHHHIPKWFVERQFLIVSFKYGFIDPYVWEFVLHATHNYVSKKLFWKKRQKRHVPIDRSKRNFLNEIKCCCKEKIVYFDKLFVVRYFSVINLSAWINIKARFYALIHKLLNK